VNVGGQNRAGIAYYVINPNSNKIVLQGQAGIANTDLTYPAVAVTQSGRGVIAFTLTGDNDYPSAALAGLDAKGGMGDVQVGAAGAGPWDGFTSYMIFGSGRPRWGRLWRSGGGRRRHLGCLRVHHPDLYLRAVPLYSEGAMRWYACCAGQLVYARQQSDSIVALLGGNHAEG